MKTTPKSIPTSLKTAFLLLVLFQIPFIVYSQDEGHWVLTGDTDPRVSTASFSEDSDGNVLIRSFKQIPPRSLTVLGLDYSPFTCVEENIINIYTPEGKWMDHKAVGKLPGIQTDEGFIPFARYNIEKSEKVFEVRYDIDGQLWMLTTKGILFCKDNMHVRLLEDIDFTKELYKSSSLVVGIAGIPEFVNKYVITEDKIYYFSNHQFNLLLQMNKKEKIYQAIQGEGDDVWVPTDKGILKCNNGVITKYLEDIDFEPGKYPYPMIEDGFAISQKSIYKYENDAFVKIKDIAENEIYQLLETDNEGRTWFINNDASFTYKVEKITKDMTSRIAYYKDGAWIEIDLPIINQLAYKTYPGNPLYFGPDGKVWINGGFLIACFDGDTTEILPIDIHKFPSNFLFHKLCFDHTGNVYISCNQVAYEFESSPNPPGVGGSLIKYTGDEVLYYSLLPDLGKKLHETYISEMMVDSRNNLWLLTRILGSQRSIAGAMKNAKSFIAKVSEAGIEVFDKKDGITGALIKQRIYEDSKGRIWIGSFMMGVFMYEYH